MMTNRAKDKQKTKKVDGSGSKERMFTSLDGSASITAGSKMAFNNMIFAKEGNGWTPTAKILAATYFDLSEKKGYAFARRKYLKFRTQASLDTISTANRVIEASGLFWIKYRANNSLRVTPNLDAIEIAYEKYAADHAAYKRSEDEWWNPVDDCYVSEVVNEDHIPCHPGLHPSQRQLHPSTESPTRVDGNSGEGRQKFRRGSSENPSRNPSIDSLDRDNLSKSVSHTRSSERVKRSRPSGDPAGNDDLGRFIAKMHRILPAHEPFEGDADRKLFDAERSRRGELPQLRKLIRAGWTKDEVQDMVEAYVKSAQDDESGAGKTYQQTYKTLSAVFTELIFKTKDQGGFEGDDVFYGRRLPERFLRKPEDQPANANDNWQPDLASGDTYGSYGGECDIDEPF